MVAARLDQVGGDRDDARAEVLAEALGLRVGTGGAGYAGGEQAVNDEVDGKEGRQFVAVDVQVGSLGEQLAEPVHGQVAAEPGVRGRTDGPQADVGRAALVARPRTAQPTEGDVLGRGAAGDGAYGIGGPGGRAVRDSCGARAGGRQGAAGGCCGVGGGEVRGVPNGPGFTVGEMNLLRDYG